MNKQGKIKALRYAMGQVKNPGKSDFNAGCVLDIYEHVLDESNVGSEKYKGLATFWSCRHKYYLRSATNGQRISIHREFNRLGLPMFESSEAHDDIVKRILKIKEI